MHEIILAEAKPALEWVNNRIVQKVSPRRKHALAQSRFCAALDEWACEHGSGMAGTEWHFQVQPPQEISRTLVPDVAYLSYDRLPKAELEQTDIPRVAPDIVVEIRSPEDLQSDIDEKTRVYLAAGTRAVFLVDPAKKSVVAYSRDHIVSFDERDMIRHDELPGFAMSARKLFDLP
jgi:Uma2 family endonuclease